MTTSPPLSLMFPPFDKSVELNSSLIFDPTSAFITRAPRRAKRDIQSTVTLTTLPGAPLVPLTQPNAFLLTDLLTPSLNAFAPHLWLVATQSSTHVSALHAQVVRGRTPVVAENPELHLVWAYDRIYIKPLPKYLLSHAFWSFYLIGASSPIPLDERRELLAASLGFVRSWKHLVRHRSDYEIARTYKLIPKSIGFTELMHFLASFGDVPDEMTSPRYHYGDLRLTRLNFWCKIALGNWSFQKMYPQYDLYFARFYAPILFVLGGISVVLSAFQVALAVQVIPDSLNPNPWARLTGTARWFSVVAMIGVCVIGTWLVGLWVAKVMREAIFALGDLMSKKRGTQAKPERGRFV